MNVWVKRALIAVPVAVALFFGAILLYVNVIKPDAPDELSTSDLSAAVAGADTTTGSTPAAIAEADAPATTGSAATAPPATAAPETAAPATTAAGATGSLDGTWAVTEGSEFGYRVEEVLFGVNTTAAGRSNQITGELVVAGATVESATFTVDVASITSDEDRRDNQFRGRIMEVEQFPGRPSR